MGNVYEALVGLLWLKGNMQSLTNIFLTLMGLDQLEYPQWGAPKRRSSTGFLWGALARKCSRFVFVHTGRSYGYANGGTSPSQGAVAKPMGPWLQKPGSILHIPVWKDGYDGPVPEGWAPPSPPPHGSPREPRNSGQGSAGSSSDSVCRSFDHGYPHFDGKPIDLSAGTSGCPKCYVLALLPVDQREPRSRRPHPRGTSGGSRAQAEDPRGAMAH